MIVFRCALLAMIAAVAVSGCAPGKSTQSTSRNGDLPHIVVLIADDLGVGYAPCLTNRGVMPFLDSMCDKSVVFDRAYSHPVCTPSRAAMMTGLDTFRTGSGDVQQEAFKLGLDEVTIPEVIKQFSPGGYQTSAFGKWHLSSDEVGGLSNPNLQGFDYFEGNPRQHHTYLYTNYDWFINGTQLAEPVQQYKTSYIVDRVTAHFLAQQNDAPQFVWVGFVNPHLPYHLPPRHLHSYDDLEDREFRSVNHEPENPDEIWATRAAPQVVPYFEAMAQALDTEITRLVRSLQESSTRPIIFVFLGDNGDAGEVRTPETTHLRGFKGLLYEAGVRVPLMIWSSQADWSAEHAQTTPRLTHLGDLFPSLTQLAGVSSEALRSMVPTTDGKSFAGLIDRRLQTDNHDSIYLQRGHPRRLPFSYGVVDASGMKLIIREFDRTQADLPNVELFNLNDDSAEQHNLFAECSNPSRKALPGLYADLKQRIRSEPHPYGSPDFARFDEYIDSYGRESQCAAAR